MHSNWLRWGAVAVAAITAGVANGAAPTGSPGIDAVERGVVAGLTALAGGFAGRWALLWGSVLVCVFSGAGGIVPGAIAVVGSAAMLAEHRRNRLAGTVVGGIVGVLGQRLVPIGPLGLVSVVGTIAALVVWISAYRRVSSRIRRPVAWVAAALCVVTLAAAGVAALAALRGRQDLQAAVESTRTGAAAARRGEEEVAQSAMRDASRRFGRQAQLFDALVLAPARLVPVLAQNVEAVRVAAVNGQRLTEVAARAGDDLRYDDLQLDGGGVDLALAEGFRKPVHDVLDSLHHAAGAVSRADSAWLAPPLADRLATFEREVDRLKADTDTAALALDHVGAILGGRATRRYLVLLANPAEGRDLGGFVGSWAILSADKGRIELEEVGLPEELLSPHRPGVVLHDPETYPVSFLDMQPANYPQNWTSALELATTRRAAVDLVPQSGHGAIDGVIYADPAAVAGLLKLTGPVTVSGLSHPIDATNAERFFTVDQFVELPQDSSGDEVVREVVRTVFDRFTRTTLPGPSRLADIFGPLVIEGHLRVDTSHEGDRGLLDRLNLSGWLPEVGRGDTPRGDMYGAVVRNAGGNKLDAYLRRETTVTMAAGAATGALDVTMRTRFTNTVDPVGLPRRVVGNVRNAPPGTEIINVSLLSVRKDATVTLDGVPAPVLTQQEGDLIRRVVPLTIPPGGSAELVTTWSGQLGRRDHRFILVGQPLPDPGKVHLEVVRDGVTTFSETFSGGETLTVLVPAS